MLGFGFVVGLVAVGRYRRRLSSSLVVNATKKTVLITGGQGNLGNKLARHLLGLGFRVVLFEHPKYVALERAPAGAIVLPVDLERLGAWADELRGVDALVHFSAVNPYPNASWADSAASMSHTFNVFLAATQHGVRRVIFASSNHVMGGYKDLPDVKRVGPLSPPRCGTLLADPTDRAKSGDAVAYAAAKLAGEQLARALSEASQKTSFISLRIGWCQPGENHPSTLNPSGSPPQFQNAVGGDSGGVAAVTEQQLDENWFQNMWLSNNDFLRYFTAAIAVDSPPGALLVLNAMSNNTGMKWSIAETEAMLGVKATDNVWLR